MNYHSAHILRTIAHYITKDAMHGLTRTEHTCMCACYRSLEDEHTKKEAQQIATLQKPLPLPKVILPILDYTQSIPCIPMGEPAHLQMQCPISLLIESTRSGRPIAFNFFSRN